MGQTDALFFIASIIVLSIALYLVIIPPSIRNKFWRIRKRRDRDRDQ